MPTSKDDTASDKGTTTPGRGRRAIPKPGQSLAALHPDIAAQWDYELNDGRPEHYTVGSGYRAHWVCENGPDHRWQTAIGSRVSGTTGCPYEGRRRVSATNNLAATRPDMAAHWDYALNDGRPEDYTAGSEFVAHWVCPNGADHRWQAKISERADRKGCPFDSGKRVSSSNNLATIRPDLAAQWNYDLNEGRPEDYTARSGYRAHWVCQNGDDHRWQTSIKNRSAKGTGCPFEIGKRISSTNSFAALHPEFAKQWDYELNERRPEDYSGSSNVRVHWICEKDADHRWQTAIGNRAVQGSGCPGCNSRWTLPKVLAYLRSVDVSSLPASHAYAIARQAEGLLDSRHGNFVMGVITGREQLPEEDDDGSIICDPVELGGKPADPVEVPAPRPADPITEPQPEPGPDPEPAGPAADAVEPVSPEPGPELDVEVAGLPIVSAGVLPPSGGRCERVIQGRHAGRFCWSM